MVKDESSLLISPKRIKMIIDQKPILVVAIFFDLGVHQFLLLWALISHHILLVMVQVLISYYSNCNPNSFP